MSTNKYKSVNGYLRPTGKTKRNIYRGFEIRKVDGVFIVKFQGCELQYPSQREAMKRIDRMANAILGNGLLE